MKKKIAIIAPACATLDDAKGSIEANQKLGVADVEFIPGNESGLSYGHVNPEFPTTRQSTEELPADSALARSNAIINAVYRCEADGLWSLDGGSSADQVAMLLTEYAKNPKNYIEKYKPTDLDPELVAIATEHPGFIQKNPDKPLPYLISYSNNTHIQQALSKHGFPVIYGANASQNEPAEDRKAALKLFVKPGIIDLTIKASHRLDSPVTGIAQIGVIDNLVTDIGTENQLIPTKDGVLFIESISDIDKFIKMTEELKVAGCLTGLKAIVVGKTRTDDDSVINSKLESLKGDGWPPIVYAPEFGHMNGKTPIQAFGNVTIEEGKISIDATEEKVRENLSTYQMQVQNTARLEPKTPQKELLFSDPAEDIGLQAVIIMADISNKVRSGEIDANTDVKITLSIPSAHPKDVVDGLSDFAPIAWMCPENGKPKFDEHRNLTFLVDPQKEPINEYFMGYFKKAGLSPEDFSITNSENGEMPKITIMKEAHEKITAASTAKRAHEIEMAKAIVNEGVHIFKLASENDFKTSIEVHGPRQQRVAVNLEQFMTTTTSVSAPISTPHGPTETAEKSQGI